MKHGTYRVYMLIRDTLHIVDVPNQEAMDRCVQTCKNKYTPCMVYRYMDDKWLNTPYGNCQTQVRDAIGHVPFKYEDKFIKDGST